MTSETAPISRLLDGMVHRSVAGDRLLAQQHRIFLAVHLGAGLLALSAIPVWLVAAGPPSIAVALTFSWLLVPLAIAGYLSHGGRLAVAHLVSAAAFAGLVVWVAGLTGGIRSPVIVCLALVPFTAVLCGTRSVVGAAVAASTLGAIGLAAADGLEYLPSAPAAANGNLFASAVIVGAVVVAGALALGASLPARQSARSADREAARLRSLLDGASDLVTRHSANGDVEYASPAIHALTGMTVVDALGEGLLRCVHPDDRPAYLKALAEARLDRQPVTVEFRLRRLGAADGESPDYVPGEMRCRAIVDGNGAATAVVAVTREVADRTAHEATLRQALASAEHASRAKTQFLAQLNHEVRTPLNAIIGFSEILDRNAADECATERSREYARLIHLSGKHLLQLIDAMLDISGIESGKFDISPEKIMIAPLIADCCNLLGPQASERGVSLNCTVSDGLPQVAADARACRQILINLLSNAIKFTNRGGAVTVGARVEGQSVALFVRDTGIGIAPEDLARLGTPSVRGDAVDPRGAGRSGLGLSLVKRLVAMHGGRLVIESEPAVGTTVTAILPIDHVPDRMPANPAGQASSPAGEQEDRKSA